MIVLIDNGHGINTFGKRSPDGKFLEYSETRIFAKEIECGLRLRGYAVERIVKEEIDVPLSERVKRVNAYCHKHGADNVLLVSIHCNAAGNGSQWLNATGWSAYTTKGVTKSDILADCLYRAAEKHIIGQRIRKDMSDGDPDWEENFYIIRHTLCPAVLTENFFMDNRADVEYMLSDDGRHAIVQTHIDGIVEYIKIFGNESI